MGDDLPGSETAKSPSPNRPIRHPLRDVVTQGTVRLAAAGVASAGVDAELLLAAALGLPRSRLALADDVPGEAWQHYQALLERRAAREPLQHILGRSAFRHVEVAVGPGVFVPRPETELLVDAVLPHLKDLPTPGVAVDLCSGSGALALAVADEAPGTRVIAVEHAPAALDWLRRNAAGTPVEVVDGDVTDPGLLSALFGRADVVVSNPPYVPERTDVAAEVRHDPAEAVFAGADGLTVIPHVLARAEQLLRPGGVLAMEHDDTHERAVPQLLAAQGTWDAIADHRDLAGRARYVTAVRTGR
jgi:release factor glutamine methyltransferase